MIQVLKRLWCMVVYHRWECGDYDAFRSSPVVFTCKRCGKQEKI